MLANGFIDGAEFEIYLNGILDTLDRFENASEAKPVDHEDKVLESLELPYSHIKDKKHQCVPLHEAYMRYACLYGAGEEPMRRTDYKRAVMQLGLVVRAGGGNVTKIYNLHSIPRILDSKDYI